MRRAARWVGALAAAALAGSLVLSAIFAPSHRPHARPRQPAIASQRNDPTGLLTEAQCIATPAVRIPCYDPAQLRVAYDEQPLLSAGVTGAGETIAVVVSFGSPTIGRDLARFDAAFGLPPPPSLKVIEPAGRVPRFRPGTTTMTGWAGEATLDVEWAHAMAPGASILVVETPVSETEGTTGFPQIATAERYVIDHGLADVISQSFGANERTFASVRSVKRLRSVYVDALERGVTILASSGDTGSSDVTTAAGVHYSKVPAVTWPASDPLVTAVGGTKLALGPSGRRTAQDRAWNDTKVRVVDRFVFGTPRPHPDATGGGLSTFFTRPSYQDGVSAVVGNQRGVPDISMSAACSGLVDTYQSFPGPTPPGWYYVCGTSEAAPLFAGVVALADQEAGHSLGFLNPALYEMAASHAPGIVDVTRGNNSVEFRRNGTLEKVAGYPSTPGYDLATGLGTVDAAHFVPELVHAVASVGDAVTYEYQTPSAPPAPTGLGSGPARTS